MHLMTLHQMTLHATVAAVSDVVEVQQHDELVTEWRGLLERHAKVFGALECALQEHGVGVSEFEALEFLAACEDHCRSADLVEAAQLSQSAASRLVARMEKAGLVERKLCELDRRGVFVALTEAGRERYEQAKPTHRAVLAETLGAV